MKITFLGAARTVTGSCFLLETDKSKVIIDCGMFQGSKTIAELNRREFLFQPSELTAVILTHAHIDHSGLIPKLIKNGYRGKVLCTKVTKELCEILLPDSAHIQESDFENAMRKNKRSGKETKPPLYTIDDAYNALKYFQEIPLYEKIKISEDIVMRYRSAGHIMGAAVVEIYVTEADKEIKLLFSGDLGQPNQPIVRDPDEIKRTDYLIIESTYGDREHFEYDKEAELEKIINETYARGGNLIIPAFAVGRTQTLLYYFQKLIQENRIPDMPIIIDSPLAIKATDIILRNPQEFDEEASDIYTNQNNKLINIKNLRFVETSQESKALNTLDTPAIIISASGMADAGRVLHHLKHNLWRPECSVLFVGFQARGSLGRLILDGTKSVKIMGERISVKAQIHNLRGFSAHADRNQLFDWLKNLECRPSGVFVVHGESDVAEIFANDLRKVLGTATYVPQYGDEALIDGYTWKIKESEIIAKVPAIQDLRQELRSMEKNYYEYRMRLEQVLNRDESKIKEISRRLQKISKYMDENLSDL